MKSPIHSIVLLIKCVFDNLYLIISFLHSCSDFGWEWRSWEHLVCTDAYQNHIVVHCRMIFQISLLFRRMSLATFENSIETVNIKIFCVIDHIIIVNLICKHWTFFAQSLRCYFWLSLCFLFYVLSDVLIHHRHLMTMMLIIP